MICIPIYVPFRDIHVYTPVYQPESQGANKQPPSGCDFIDEDSRCSDGHPSAGSKLRGELLLDTNGPEWF